MNGLMDTALDYLHKINSLGYKAYIVGGAVRDTVQGLEVSDVDVATNCPMSVLSEHFSTYDIGRSKEFGIAVVLFKGQQYETAQFRTESGYSDGRRPDAVEIIDDIVPDLARRDFTINAMAMDGDGSIVDPFDGKKDLEDKLVRAVGDPVVRFTEDHLRMMRLARFGAIDGFSIEKKTRIAARRLSHLIHNATNERIRMELVKAADQKKSGEEFARFIRLLDRLGILSKILPELTALKQCKEDLVWHPEGPTTFEHTMAALRMLENKPWISKTATLFHDLGKATHMDESKYNYKCVYHGHEKGSVELIGDIGDRLRFSANDTECMMFAAGHHMHFHVLLEMRPSKIARMVNSPYFETLVDVAYADQFARGELFETRDKFWAALDRAYEVKKLWEERIAKNKTTLVSGTTIMNVLGIKPGPIVGKVKRRVEDAVLDGKIDMNDKASLYGAIMRSFLIKEENDVETV